MNGAFDCSAHGSPGLTDLVRGPRPPPPPSRRCCDDDIGACRLYTPRTYNRHSRDAARHGPGWARRPAPRLSCAALVPRPSSTPGRGAAMQYEVCLIAVINAPRERNANVPMAAQGQRVGRTLARSHSLPTWAASLCLALLRSASLCSASDSTHALILSGPALIRRPARSLMPRVNLWLCLPDGAGGFVGHDLQGTCERRGQHSLFTVRN